MWLRTGKSQWVKHVLGSMSHSWFDVCTENSEHFGVVFVCSTLGLVRAQPSTALYILKSKKKDGELGCVQGAGPVIG